MERTKHLELLLLPYGSATQIDVKISPTVLDAHEAVLLNLGVHHVVDGVGRLDLQLLQVSRPDLVHPVDLTNDARSDDLEQNKT